MLDGVRSKLLSPEAIAEAVRLHRQAAENERRAVVANRAPIERELAEIERKLHRAQEMCLNEAISIADLKSLTQAHDARRADLEAKLSKIETPIDVAMHPGAAQAYGRLAGRLHEVLEGPEGEMVRAELRKLIERADFEPMEGLGRFGLRIHGKLAALLGVPRGPCLPHGVRK